MPIAGKLLSILLIILLACLGWVCVFKTELMVQWARNRYQQSSKFVQGYPFASMVLKPWYPMYLRSMGFFVWFFDFLIIMVVFFPQRLP